MTAPCGEGRCRLPVAVLGATGLVGQQIVRRLVRHPWLVPAELTGSGRSAGLRYGDAVNEAVDAPDEVLRLSMKGPDEELTSPVVLSALPAAEASVVEPRLAGEGRLVCSNASAHRMRPDVPLVIPEVNAEALSGLADQPWSGAGGALVTNPNCVVAGLALVLAPIHRRWGVDAVTLTTLQAVSGAGTNGPHALELLGNVVPHIAGEEEKIEGETKKITGIAGSVAVTVTRVPVMDGHTGHVFLRLRRPPDDVREVAGVLRSLRPPAGVAGLPSVPPHPVRVVSAADRPQPRLDIEAGDGMVVTVGRLRRVPGHQVALTFVVHNTVRGAAGACIANAELCLSQPAATWASVFRRRSVSTR